MDERVSNTEAKRKRTIQFITKFSPGEYEQFIALHSKLYIDKSALVRFSLLEKSQKIVTNVKGILVTLDRLGPAIASSGDAIGLAAATWPNQEISNLPEAQKLEELLHLHISLQGELEAHMRKLIYLMGNH